MILNKRQFVVSGTVLLLFLAGLLVASLLFGERSKPALEAANGQISCGSKQFDEYTKYMVLAGEAGISRQPASGTLAQQQQMVDTFATLALPKDKTVVAVGHFKTGKVYTQICENERCTHEEIAKPANTCLIEHWDNCPYLAMQFRQKQYCLLWPSDQ